MLIAGIALLILLAFGFPIAIVLGISSVIYMLATDSLNLMTSAPQRMFNGVETYGLLAIPLFMLVGELMNQGGVSNRIIKSLSLLMGHLKGGLAYANVVANVFLASILGSANAQSAIMNRVMVPEMEKEGYKREFSAALTASSSLMGPIIPPSMIFILYGVLAGVSINGLFLAGIIPGLLFALAFVGMIYALSFKYNFKKTDRASAAVIAKYLLQVIPSLSIPVIIIWGILTGVFTPTESAAIGCLIAFILGMFVYKELKWSDLSKVFINTAVNTSIITFIIVNASLFSWVMAMERIPHLIMDFIMSIATSPLMFLVLVNILFLVIGMFMDEMAAIIILVPILMPIVSAYGIDPIHFGVIIAINATIGLITPPVGYVLFTTSSIAEVKYERLVRAIIPFVAISLLILLIITYVPAVTTWIPQLFG
ncbi:TRAP transporter large permease [Alkalihalobacillus sp. MEB130]|uniref:TRAP transporter large permease n=1 Tax=Alkalihalobacillus sp. MEB130 TaxID=2976704 RepID=UPI0028E058FF|nr:TRAP transporter large permease [Alkalihalobacillus sp. MEB130]MDT8861366.1 TRAP transporter large permease [Alkalihalobacillus sp. MEB130]